MNITSQPVRQKRGRFKPDPKRLDDLHECECIVCKTFGEVQLSPVSVHHPICGRLSQTKTPDAFGLPFCDGHHQGDKDTSKPSVHRDRAAFLDAYGPDHKFINIVRREMGEAEIDDEILGEWF